MNNSSGINSSNVRIGLRNSENSINEKVEVDKNILAAGQHHGSTYYQHLAFLNAIKNKLKPEVSLNDGMISVAIGEAAEKSVKEKRIIKMKELIN